MRPLEAHHRRVGVESQFAVAGGGAAQRLGRAVGDNQVENDGGEHNARLQVPTKHTRGVIYLEYTECRQAQRKRDYLQLG